MAKEKEKTEVAKGKHAGEVQRAVPTRAISPFHEMDRIFESFFPDWMRTSPLWGSVASPMDVMRPRVDIVDRDEEVLVRAELPGVTRENLEVSLNGSHVTIKASTAHEEKEEKGDYYRAEISRGSYSRTIALPAEVDGDRAKATFKNGVLELALPKIEKAKRHSIKVD